MKFKMQLIGMKVPFKTRGEEKKDIGINQQLE